MRNRIWLALVVVLSFPALSFAALPRLDELQRDRLRYRLEHVWNEVDLLVLNQRANAADVRRQERELEAFRIFQRIPFHTSEKELKEELLPSAQAARLKIQSVKVTERSKPGKPIPSSIRSDQPMVKLRPEQVGETIQFQMDVEGDEGAVQHWFASWGQTREDEVPGTAPTPRVLRPLKARKLGGNVWRLTGETYRFREIRFPTIRPPDPVELLPAWAMKNTESFAASEPLLWRYVERIRAKTPEALPLYRNREQFLLNSARMSFFLSKVKKPDLH